MPQRTPHVVVVGAGFAGLEVVKGLKRTPVRVTLVDQHNHHTFQPLLYQVAGAQLDAGEVAHQVRAVLRRQANARFLQGTVTGVDWTAKTVRVTDPGAPGAPDGVPPDDVHDLAFDELVVAPGAIYADFGVPGVREHAHFLKSLSEAVNLRSALLRRFEAAAAAEARGDAPKPGTLTFAIIGGGPTGVEMAGALAELVHGVLPGDYPDLDLARARIVLLEMSDALLPPFAPASQRHARRVLERRGVEVRTGAAVAEVRRDGLVLEGGDVLPAHTTIWAAGVEAHPLAKALGLETTRGGRLVTAADLSLPGTDGGWAAGDVAATHDDDGRLHPQVAPVAIQHGQHVARAIRAKLAGRPTPRFHYADKGMMAIIGRNAGVAELSRRLGGLQLRGFLGWLGWLLIHLVYLPGHRNRLGAFVTWAYAYLTRDRHARLITAMEPSPAERTGRTGRVVTVPPPDPDPAGGTAGGAAGGDTSRAA
ncbi:MAG: NAD(P)/FAD-dependent oxidoreductase [Trueperaceae bacterium]|nr:NAD(P)/FAD-dependent oxidoreductase [Trueperaceae bacterium]